MELLVKESAVAWFKKEMDVQQGDALRFFVRMGGCSTVQSGFSLGVAKEPPNEAGVSVTIDGIIFFVEKEDVWYFDNTNLVVDYNPEKDEIEYTHETTAN
ncbi:HesB/YadR/YfhF family protein [Aneurinibacillus terranovensis]|uniref:HesB/YadR/YfhF family protein n=1 Tax=Aneurinibacillus terranovensis TaxID=278991 RepID=UPI000412E941|nr:HesB/YadR/YfhF family protein [Aneurinibacillus terranovensis]